MPDASASLLATSRVYTNILSLSSLLVARSSLLPRRQQERFPPESALLYCQQTDGCKRWQG